MVKGIDAAVFREVCGRFATGVAVVTTLDEAGNPAGMTANSFTSVSLLPPLISVSVDHRADMHRRILRAPTFAVNILEQRQEALSRRFADDHPDRFAGVGHHPGETGLPLLDGTIASLECERFADHEAGDHTIILGLVVSAAVGAGRPLLYYRGGYWDPEQA